jgi:hypothetical protein
MLFSPNLPVSKSVGPRLTRHRVGRMRYNFARVTVTAVDRLPYGGPIYAFEVERDKSLVAAGMVLHHGGQRRPAARLLQGT